MTKTVTPNKAQITDKDVKAAKQAIENLAKPSTPKTPAEVYAKPSPYNEEVRFYILAHKLAVISDIEGMSPKDLLKHKQVLAKYSIRLDYLSELVVRKAEQICVEWTNAIKAMNSGKV